MRRLWLWALAALVLPGCQRCSSRTAARDAGEAPLAVGTPARAAAPAMRPLDTPQGFGLPGGCSFEGKVEKAKLPQGRTRFVAPRTTLDALALAHGESSVTSAGFVDLATRSVSDAPWAELEVPPLMDRARAGWLAAWLDSTAHGTRRALLWRGGASAEVLAEGDQLELSDVACAGDDCALLSSLVRSAAAPGASWLAGKAGAPASSWKRTDLDLGGDEPWLPLAIAGLAEGGAGWAALSSGKHVALFAVSAERAEKKQVLDAPHGAYDATLGPEPLVIVPGDRIDRPCGAEEFPLVVLGPGGQRHELRTPAPPESVIARPLAHGALLAWVAPVSCQLQDRRVVYLTRLEPSGAPAASPMAVADATGFALATRGDELSLWLISGQELSWVRARCPKG